MVSDGQLDVAENDPEPLVVPESALSQPPVLQLSSFTP